MNRIFLCLLLQALLTAGLPTAATAQPDPPRGDVRLVVISDLNGSYGSTGYDPLVDSTIARIRRVWQPDVVLIAGDMIAAQKRSLTDSTVRAMWRAFDRHVAAPLREAGIPFGFTIGNHDGSASGFTRDRRLAAAYWQHPAHDPGVSFVDSSRFPFQYSFLHDSLYVVAWDASSAKVQDASHVTQMLARPEAKKAAMRLVLGHLPLYAVAEGRNRPGEILQRPDSLRMLLAAHKVHTYISGHHHAYFPGRRGELELLHSGILGGGPRPLLGQTEPSPRTVTILDVDPASSRMRYTTLDARTLTPVDLHTLPQVLRGINGYVLRRDVQTLP